MSPDTPDRWRDFFPARITGFQYQRGQIYYSFTELSRDAMSLTVPLAAIRGRGTAGTFSAVEIGGRMVPVDGSAIVWLRQRKSGVLSVYEFEYNPAISLIPGGGGTGSGSGGDIFNIYQFFIDYYFTLYIVINYIFYYILPGPIGQVRIDVVTCVTLSDSGSGWQQIVEKTPVYLPGGVYTGTPYCVTAPICCTPTPVGCCVIMTCDACPDAATYFTFTAAGFTGACSVLNGEWTVIYDGSGCTWTGTLGETTATLTLSKPGDTVFADLIFHDVDGLGHDVGYSNTDGVFCCGNMVLNAVLVDPPCGEYPPTLTLKPCGDSLGDGGYDCTGSGSPGCRTVSCGSCPDTAVVWRVAVGGVLNGLCASCDEQNGVFDLTFLEPCIWVSPLVGNSCGPSLPRVEMSYYAPADEWRLALTVANAVYALAGADWKCDGPNTLTRTSHDPRGVCDVNSLPATLTVYPVGCCPETGSGGVGGSGVIVACCGVPVPLTLYATIVGSGVYDGTYPILYDPGALPAAGWRLTLPGGCPDFPGATDMILLCDPVGGLWSLANPWAGIYQQGTFACPPTLSISFLGVAFSNCGGGATDGNVLITQTP